MIKKTASYFFIVFGLAVLYISSSPYATYFMKVKRDNNKWWGEFQFISGDLAARSHLNFMKKFSSVADHPIADKSGSAYPKNSVLYLMGDSYTVSLNANAFEGLSDFHFIFLYRRNPFHLDTTKRNVLVMEVCERYVREFFGHKLLYNTFFDSTVKNRPLSDVGTQETGAYLSKINFSRQLNRNLEFNLFGYTFMLPVYNCKAAINYYLFGRASGDVVVSNNREFLFFEPTVSNSGNASSYVAVPQAELSQIVSNLNEADDYYRRCGFKEVYLSIVPNTATMVQSEFYNNLIPLLQHDPNLKIKIIDVYSALKTSPESLFFNADTHWNNTGRQKYVDLVNNILIKH